MTARTLIVSDLDGTLLRPDGSLSEYTARVVNEYVAQGGLFTYATARSYTTASRATAPLELQLPVITYGGAILVDPATGEASAAHTMTGEAVGEALNQTPVEAVVYAICEGRDRVCWLEGRETPAVVDFLAKRVGDPRLLPLRSWSAIDPATVFYISLIGDREPLADLHQRLASLAADCNLTLMEDIYARGQWWLEMTAASASKAAAVGRLKAELHPDTVVCIGDNLNDLPMLALADTALAVGNADPAVQAVATRVIGDNATDGVAAWISEYSRQ